MDPTMIDVEELYADRQYFDRNGEPWITIGLMSKVKRVVISADGPIELLGDHQRMEVPPNTEIAITLSSFRPQKSRFFVQLGYFGAQNLDRAISVLEFTKQKTPDARIFEAGALIGFAGYAFDARSYTLVTGESKTRAQAERKAIKRFGTKDHVYEDVQKHPGGIITAQSTTGDLTFSVQDLLTVRALDLETLIKVKGDKRDERYDRGDLLFLSGPTGQLEVVNQISAELLIAGVVPSEIYPDAPLEALKAQAVAARGLLISKMGTRHRGEPYSLCATAHCQVYNGQNTGSPLIDRAVRETRGEVLFQKSGPTNTVYHSSCGGQLESSLSLWKIGDSALQSIPDGGLGAAVGVGMMLAHKTGAYCAKSGMRFGDYRWEKSISADQLLQNLKRALPKEASKLSTVTQIQVAHRTQSGRVDQARYVGPEGQVTAEGQTLNQRILGRLKSSLWQVKQQGPQFVIQGGGFGHGVGLCQHGAIGMAQAGFTYRQILSHYYQGTTLRKLW